MHTQSLSTLVTRATTNLSPYSLLRGGAGEAVAVVMHKQIAAAAAAAQVK